MNVYICEDLSCCYRLHNGTLEYVPLNADDTFDLDGFGQLDDEGSTEEVMFRGRTRTLAEVHKAVRAMLTLKDLGV